MARCTRLAHHTLRYSYGGDTDLTYLLASRNTLHSLVLAGKHLSLQDLATFKTLREAHIQAVGFGTETVLVPFETLAQYLPPLLHTLCFVPLSRDPLHWLQAIEAILTTCMQRSIPLKGVTINRRTEDALRLVMAPSQILVDRRGSAQNLRSLPLQ